MADKILQDPSKQKFFERSSIHELFELPKKVIEEDRNLENLSILKKRMSSNKDLENLEEEVKGSSNQSHKRVKRESQD